MNIKLELYNKQKDIWPEKGKHILAQFNKDEIIVYQSYRKEIGLFAAKHQYFGGDFKLSRMTWIKPNFLWMMYRNGWGTKDGQEITLAIHLKMSAFEKYLNEVVYSTFNPNVYSDHESWKIAVQTSNARLQWDPDHDPYGKPLERKAIQIGIRNELIKTYSHDDIILIEDITDYVYEQNQYVVSNQSDKLKTPVEKPLIFKNKELNKKLQLGHQ